MIETVLHQGQETGFSTVEAFREKTEAQEFESLVNGKVSHHAVLTDRISVRAFWDLGDPVGFQLSSPDPHSVNAAFAQVYATRLPDRKKNYARLLPGGARKVTIDIFDESVDSINSQTFAEMVDRVREILVRYPGLRLRRIYLAGAKKKVYIANTHGLNTKYKKTHFSLVLSFARQQDLVDVSEDRVLFNQINPLGIVDQAAFLLNSLTENKAAFDDNTYFLLSPEASTFILKEFSDYLRLDGERKRVNFSFPAILNLVDDPLLDRQVGSVPFDDEGVQGGERSLIRKGVVRDRISNIQTAFENGSESSGNGFRNNRSIFPAVNFSNLYIKATVLPLSNLMKEAGQGILVSLIKLKRLDQDKYLFSAYGYRFAGSELKEAVHFYFKTSFISYFLNVIKVSAELRFFNSAFNIGSPYILLEAKRKAPDMFDI